MIPLRKWARRLALAFLLLTSGAAFFPEFLSSSRYEQQFREYASVKPCRRFPLGTDELGRDRLCRLLYGIRVSLLLAPAAAGVAITIALACGLLAGYCGGFVQRLMLGGTDLFASVPSILLLFTSRALLPLNLDPIVSVCFTFLLLGLLGWTSAVRVILAAVVNTRTSDFVLQAKAYGCRPFPLIFRHIACAIRPVVTAQFWLLTPIFLLAEANLGMLGLGVTEPLPSWGNMLAELQTGPPISAAPWLLTPALLLLAFLLSMQLVLRKEPS
jgi:ABC-type dipeptide/oligopeptide/nickel transport system permease subunit